MSMPRRLTRAESKTATRAVLLRSAGRLFLRNGYVATSLADIAVEAGVTKGAVYSNFASKEDLFLALLSEPVGPSEPFAPTAAGLAAQGGERSERAFGAYANSVRPSPAHVSLFLETNAAALRTERSREFVAGRMRRFATRLGTGLAELFDAPAADPLQLGLIAQSLYAGLMMHGAYLDEIDEHTFVVAYEMLAVAARVDPRVGRAQS